MKDRLYKVIHWISRAVEGLRADEVPTGSVGSDALVTIAMRGMETSEEMRALKKDLDENGAEAVDRLFNYHFTVLSLNGETGEKIDREDMMQTWLFFTLYMRHVVFPEWENHAHGKLLEVVLNLLSKILGASLLEAVVANADKLRDTLGCDTCKKRDECPVSKRTEGKCDRESDMEYN